MNILLIDSNDPINNRNLKFIESLSNYSDVKLVLATWNRIGDKGEITYKVNKQYIYQKKSKLGNRFRKLVNIFGYYFFIKKINNIEKPDIIIASHWDMLLLSSFIRTKNQFLVYENLDIPTHNNKLLLFTLQSLEKIALKKTDYIIHASRFYKQLYGFFTKEQQILENLPIFDNDRTILNTNINDKIIISFIGGIRYTDVLFKLIEEASKFDTIEIHLHGEGHESEKLQQFVMDNNFENNVLITGKYNYNDISKFYQQSHLIWAVYPSNNFNVKYAISNKFHESIYFNVPGIYAKNTALGDFVKDNNIGLTVDDTNEGIYNLLYSIVKADVNIDLLRENLRQFKLNDRNSWQDGIEFFYHRIKQKLI